MFINISNESYQALSRLNDKYYIDLFENIRDDEEEEEQYQKALKELAKAKDVENSLINIALASKSFLDKVKNANMFFPQELDNVFSKVEYRYYKVKVKKEFDKNLQLINKESYVLLQTLDFVDYKTIKDYFYMRIAKNIEEIPKSTFTELSHKRNMIVFRL